MKTRTIKHKEGKNGEVKLHQEVVSESDTTESVTSTLAAVAALGLIWSALTRIFNELG